MKAIAVVGAGTMGAGIAQLAAQYGCIVHLIDVNDEVLRQGISAINKRFDRSVEKGRMTASERDDAVARIKPAKTIENLADVGLAIEAVVEDIDVKRKVFTQLAQATPATAVLATNTSSLSVSRIAESVSDPTRVVGMHFFNPAPVMALVEVIAGEKSSSASVDAAYEVAKAWGKVPVRAKDTPGFIVNRVARGFYLEALRLLGEGVAGVDEIDLVMKTHGRFRMGPFELMDLVGLDVNLAVTTSVWEQMDRHARFTPHEIQQTLVAAGHLGRKTGRGFYSYDGDHAVPAYTVERRSFYLDPKLRDITTIFAMKAGAILANSTEQLVFCRILGAVLNEAGAAYTEGVASASDIDTAMQKGTNYPKGPLAWSDEIGHRNVRGLLKSLDADAGDGRYAPARLFADAE